MESSKPSLFRQQFLRTQSKTSGSAGKKMLKTRPRQNKSHRLVVGAQKCVI
jgi:hypothetical protein